MNPMNTEEVTWGPNWIHSFAFLRDTGFVEDFDGVTFCLLQVTPAFRESIYPWRRSRL